MNRQIRTPSTIFSFDILETNGALAADILSILRVYKPILAYASVKWQLPRIVRCLMEDLRTFDNLACKCDGNTETYHQIRIDLNNAHELENACYDVTEFRRDI